MGTADWAIVCKYLEAVQDDTFNPRGACFQVGWTANTAPDPALKKQNELLALECCRSGNNKLSKEAMASFVRLLSRQLEIAESMKVFNLVLLQSFDPGLRTFKHQVAPLVIGTARTFAVPQLHAPHPLLLAKEWQRDGDSGILPSRLWIHVATFLAPLVGRRWWENASHPLVIILLDEHKNGVGIALLQPPGIDSGLFITPTLMNSLLLFGMYPPQNWEAANLKALRKLLGSVAGLPHGSLQEHEKLQISDAVHAAGLYLRLQSKVPVILVGDLDAHADIALCKLASSMLQSEFLVVDVKDGLDMDDPAFQACVTAPTLLLMRCVEDSWDEVVALLHACLIGRCCRKTWTLASLHYVHASAMKLQQQLPRQLREAVVFL